MSVRRVSALVVLLASFLGEAAWMGYLHEHNDRHYAGWLEGLMQASVFLILAVGLVALFMLIDEAA